MRTPPAGFRSYAVYHETVAGVHTATVSWDQHERQVSGR